jgi:hypothetical protein
MPKRLRLVSPSGRVKHFTLPRGGLRPRRASAADREFRRIHSRKVAWIFRASTGVSPGRRAEFARYGFTDTRHKRVLCQREVETKLASTLGKRRPVPLELMRFAACGHAR